jgi:acyl carrier protein
LSATLDRVKKVVVEKLNVSDNEVTETASFIDDLGADSLGVVELVMGFEDEFGIQIPDEDAEKIQTVSQAVAYVDSKVG